MIFYYMVVTIVFIVIAQRTVATGKGGIRPALVFWILVYAAFMICGGWLSSVLGS